MGDTVPFELIRKASEGDSEVFEQVFSPLLEPAYYLALGLLQDRGLAEDAVIKATQSAFATLGDVRAGTSLRKWFVAIVLRQCRSVKPLAAIAGAPAEDPDAVQTPDELLGEALMGLRYQDRCIVVMHHYVDLPIDEVAQLEGLSIEATRSRLDKTLTKLGPMFADAEGWFRIDDMLIAKRLHDLIDGLGPPSPEFWDNIRKALAKPPTRRDRLQGVIAVCAALLAVAVVLTIPSGWKSVKHTGAVVQHEAGPLIADILKESPVPLLTPSPQASPAAPADESPSPNPTAQPRPTTPPPDPGSPTIAGANLPEGEVGVGYPSVQLSASGGTQPYSWSLSAPVPAGFSISSGGALSGTPGAAGSPLYVVVKVTDNRNRSSYATFPATVYAAVAFNDTAPHNGEVGVMYSPVSYTAAQGKGPFTWTFTPANPGGLNSSGLATPTSTLGGNPAASAYSGSFQVKVTDNLGGSVTRNYSFAGGNQIYPAINAATAAFHPGEAGFNYSPVTVSSTGGTGSYTWSLVPANGLGISGTGVVSGTPAAAATTIVVRVSDGLATRDTTFSVPIASQVGLSPATVHGGQKNMLYNPPVVFSGTGGTGGYSGFTFGGGPLPTGMTYVAATHTLAGTPTQSGTFNFTITVQDNNVAACGGTGCVRVISYSLVIAP